MTTPRDHDRLLRAYLAEGMHELPDHVIDAVLNDVHSTRQRARWGSWRLPLMPRSVLGPVVAIVLIVVGVAWIGLPRLLPSAGTPSLAPSASDLMPSPPPSVVVPSTSVPSVVPSARPDLTVGGPIMPAPTILSGGGEYHSVGFSAPLAFRLPAYRANPGSSADPGGLYNGRVWADGHTIGLDWNGGDYALTIHDDIRLSRDLCHPTDLLTDVPASPAAVGAWLRASKGLVVNEVPDLSVDGRVAKAWDVTVGSSCWDAHATPPGGPAIYFGRGEVHRVYAVPSGDDTLLVVTWANTNEPAKINPESNGLVQSLVFSGP